MQYAIEMVIEKGRYSWVPELISDVSVENITTYFYRSHITDPEFDSLVAETYRSLPPKKVKELGENLEKLIGMLRIMPMMLRKDSDQYPAVRLHSRCWRLCT